MQRTKKSTATRTRRVKARQAAPSGADKVALGRRTAALKAFLESKPGTTAHPLKAATGSVPLVELYKVAGKMFAIVSVRREEYVILKCDPHLADVLRGKYAGIGHRSHLDRRYWISVALDADVPAAEVRRLVDHSYGLVCAGLTRKQKASLAAT